MPKLTKEERLARARAKVERLKEVGQKSFSSDRMDWKPRAKIYLHPETEINDRLRVWFQREVAEKDDDGKETGKKKIVSIPYVVPDDPKACPFSALRELLRARDDIDPDEVILSVGKGRGKAEYCKGEILGLKGYDFRKNLKPQADFVVAAVLVEDSKKNRPKELKLEVLAGAKSLATEIRKEIESEIDESGEEKGNPFFEPYPFIIEYDDRESGSDMYSARGRPTEGPGDDAELTRILDGECLDLSDELELSDPDAMLAALNDALVRDDLEIEIENDGEVFRKPKAGAREPEPKEKPRAKAKEPEKAPEKAPEKEPEPKAEREPPKSRGKEEEPEEPPKAPRVKKATSKKKEAPKKELGWEPGEGEEYDICPKCREKVPQDATKCPHPGCGAEYVSEDEEF